MEVYKSQGPDIDPKAVGSCCKDTQVMTGNSHIGHLRIVFGVWCWVHLGIYRSI